MEAFMGASLIKKAIEASLDGWAPDFEIDVWLEEEHNGYQFFEATLQHKLQKNIYTLYIRLTPQNEPEIDFWELRWESICTKNLFIWLWFEGTKQDRIIY